jgi:hypothetical protein
LTAAQVFVRQGTKFIMYYTGVSVGVMVMNSCKEIVTELYVDCVFYWCGWWIYGVGQLYRVCETKY